MKTEQVQTVEPQLQQVNEAEEQRPAIFDFSECKRIKKLTTHDIYKFKHQNLPLVVKLFAPEALQNYQQQCNFLSRMKLKQILQIMYHRPALNPTSCEPLQKSHLIVLKEATRGDLNDYLPRFGRMTEKMARTYFRELVEGLSAAAKLKPAIIHPNLQASSVLLSSSGQLYICGWSEISTKDQETRLQQCIFSCGEILICLLTSFMPFYKKYSTSDAFFKFIHPDHIHKFWQELQKRMNRIDKTFVFSAELKKLVQGIFLKKIKTFQQIQTEQWIKGDIYNSEQLQEILQSNETLKSQKIEARRQQELANEQKRKKALRQFQLSYGLQRSSQTGDEQFITDYQTNMIKEQDLQMGNNILKVQGSPGFIVASLMEFLRQQNGKASMLVEEQFVLSNHKVIKVNNFIIINLEFSVTLLEEEEDQSFLPPAPADIVALKLKLSFSKHQKQLFAQIEVLQSNFNSYYTNLTLHLLQNRIHKKREGELQNLQKK